MKPQYLICKQALSCEEGCKTKGSAVQTVLETWPNLHREHLLLLILGLCPQLSFYFNFFRKGEDDRLTPQILVVVL